MNFCFCLGGFGIVLIVNVKIEVGRFSKVWILGVYYFRVDIVVFLGM